MVELLATTTFISIPVFIIMFCLYSTTADHLLTIVLHLTIHYSCGYSCSNQSTAIVIVIRLSPMNLK